MANLTATGLLVAFLFVAAVAIADGRSLSVAHEKFHGDGGTCVSPYMYMSQLHQQKLDTVAVLPYIIARSRQRTAY
jgi:hypothetical protein